MSPLLRGLIALSMIAADAPLSAQVVYSSTGPNPAAIQPTVDAFRAGLGNLNPNVAGSAGSGRREINWDGVPDAAAAPNNLVGDFFNVNSPRGVVLSTPGSGVQVSANAASGTPTEFGNINPTYPSLFSVFSAQRIFTPLGSNILDVNFFIPGSTTPALVSGFGVVFTDVDLANSTSFSLFDASDALLGTWLAPNSSGNETLSFLGILYAQPSISRVRITSGNTALAAGANESGGIDLVAMDDFIFGEPVVRAVPEPATWAMLVAGFGLIGWRIRRRKPGQPTLA